MVKDHFAAEAERIFAPSLLAYGMRRTDTSAYRVRFENDDVFVDIRYDYGRSFELDIEIAQKRQPSGGSEPPYSMGEVLRLRGVDVKTSQDVIVAEELTTLTAGLERLMGSLIDYAGHLMRNDTATFDALLELRDRETSAYAVESRLSSRRARAAKAWEERDYARFVKALESEELLLTTEELTQLREARKQLPSL